MSASDGMHDSLARLYTITRVARAYLGVIFAWLLVLGVFNLRHPSDWAMGDWLINYSDGFVRRGLIGALVSWLRQFHISQLWSVLLLQWTLYLVVLGTIWHLIRRVEWPWWLAAMFFSPATLSFVLLDPPFAFRKEILLFALLALELLLLRPPAAQDARRQLLVSLLLTAGCAVCVLAHEGLIVFFPYLFAAALLSGLRLQRAVLLALAPAVISAALFVVVSHVPGNAETATVICHSIGGTVTTPPSGICGGAINYLSHDSAYAHGEVARLLRGGGYWLLTPWLFLLPLLPAALGLWRYRSTHPRAARVLVLCSGLAWLLSISLFYYGTDWTRWIYIHVFCLMLLMLFYEAGPARLQRQETPLGQHRFSLLATVGLFIYALGWQLTVYGQRPLYVSFVRFFTHNLLTGKQ